MKPCKIIEHGYEDQSAPRFRARKSHNPSKKTNTSKIRAPRSVKKKPKQTSSNTTTESAESINSNTNDALESIDSAHSARNHNQTESVTMIVIEDNSDSDDMDENIIQSHIINVNQNIHSNDISMEQNSEMEMDIEEKTNDINSLNNNNDYQSEMKMDSDLIQHIMNQSDCDEHCQHIHTFDTGFSDREFVEDEEMKITSEGISSEAIKINDYLSGCVECDLAAEPSTTFQKYHDKLCCVKNGITVREANMKCVIMRQYDDAKDKLLNNKFVHVTECADGVSCTCDGYGLRNKCDHLLLFQMIKGGNPTMIPIQVWYNICWELSSIIFCNLTSVHIVFV